MQILRVKFSTIYIKVSFGVYIYVLGLKLSVSIDNFKVVATFNMKTASEKYFFFKGLKEGTIPWWKTLFMSCYNNLITKLHGMECYFIFYMTVSLLVCKRLNSKVEVRLFRVFYSVWHWLTEKEFKIFEIGVSKKKNCFWIRNIERLQKNVVNTFPNKLSSFHLFIIVLQKIKKKNKNFFFK